MQYHLQDEWLHPDAKRRVLRLLDIIISNDISIKPYRLPPVIPGNYSNHSYRLQPHIVIIATTHSDSIKPYRILTTTCYTG